LSSPLFSFVSFCCACSFFLAAAILLGGLQLFWGYRILAILWSIAAKAMEEALEEEAIEEGKKKK
jgi:ABC-type branched-subunit amino acid transport system permease subunit